jgi:lactoylglutathione lyase
MNTKYAKGENMKIEHIAMYVNDLEKARKFFVTYFNASSNDGYHNNLTGFRSYFLTFEEGARLELMNKPVMEDEPKTLTRTGLIHIALSVGGKEGVDALTARLKEDGYPVISGLSTTGDGYYESCIIGLENNQIEITV